MTDDEHREDQAPEAKPQEPPDEPRYLTADEILATVPMRFSLRNRPVRLQALSGAQFDELARDAAGTDMGDREFVARFIARQAIEPQLSEEDLARWSDDELLDALRQWVDQSDDEVDVEGDLTFGSFRDWARREADKIRAQMEEIYDRFRMSPAAEELTRLAQRLSPTFDQTILNRLAQPITRQQLEGVLGPSQQLMDFGKQLSRIKIPSDNMRLGAPPPIKITSPDRQIEVMADLSAARREAEEARRQLAMDQVQATRELVDISKGQSDALLATVAELKGIRDDQKDSTRWSKVAALAAGGGALVAAIGVAVTWLLSQ